MRMIQEAESQQRGKIRMIRSRIKRRFSRRLLHTIQERDRQYRGFPDFTGFAKKKRLKGILKPGRPPVFKPVKGWMRLTKTHISMCHLRSLADHAKIGDNVIPVMIQTSSWSSAMTRKGFKTVAARMTRIFLNW
jgi:hypothetical protein